MVQRKENDMKGYPVAEGYMGFDPETGMYMLFASEEDYREYIECA